MFNHLPSISCTLWTIHVKMRNLVDMALLWKQGPKFNSYHRKFLSNSWSNGHCICERNNSLSEINVHYTPIAGIATVLLIVPQHSLFSSMWVKQLQRCFSPWIDCLEILGHQCSANPLLEQPLINDGNPWKKMPYSLPCNILYCPSKFQQDWDLLLILFPTPYLAQKWLDVD